MPTITRQNVTILKKILILIFTKTEIECQFKINLILNKVKISTLRKEGMKYRAGMPPKRKKTR